MTTFITTGLTNLFDCTVISLVFYTRGVFWHFFHPNNNNNNDNSSFNSISILLLISFFPFTFPSSFNRQAHKFNLNIDLNKPIWSRLGSAQYSLQPTFPSYESQQFIRDIATPTTTTTTTHWWPICEWCDNLLSWNYSNHSHKSATWCGVVWCSVLGWVSPGLTNPILIIHNNISGLEESGTHLIVCLLDGIN